MFFAYSNGLDDGAVLLCLPRPVMSRTLEETCLLTTTDAPKKFHDAAG
jgi:hypothetical protein